MLSLSRSERAKKEALRRNLSKSLMTIGLDCPYGLGLGLGVAGSFRFNWGGPGFVSAGFWSPLSGVVVESSGVG
jgi:hypothetical protein